MGKLQHMIQMTMTNFGYRCGSKTMMKREFDVVIIDEATQALEGNNG